MAYTVHTSSFCRNIEREIEPMIVDFLLINLLNLHTCTSKFKFAAEQSSKNYTFNHANVFCLLFVSSFVVQMYMYTVYCTAASM